MIDIENRADEPSFMMISYEEATMLALLLQEQIRKDAIVAKRSASMPHRQQQAIATLDRHRAMLADINSRMSRRIQV